MTIPELGSKASDVGKPEDNRYHQMFTGCPYHPITPITVEAPLATLAKIIEEDPFRTTASDLSKSPEIPIL